MKFSYGIADFKKIIHRNCYYVDRTQTIQMLEASGDQLLFLRPRRFGKSLLLSMLENYYSVAKEDVFEETFGQLAIGQKPTELHSRYIVLNWDFSCIESLGDVEKIQKALYDHINQCIDNCVKNHAHYLPADTVDINQDNALASLASLLTAVQQTPYKLYLLIDEYDNFANEVAMSGTQQVGKERYEAIVQGQGILKTVFKAVKSAASGRGLDRVFITGVSPLVLSDMTSGYNVAKNISLEPEFADLCGFTEAEIVEVLSTLAQEHPGLPDQSETLELMRASYNGYRFSEGAKERVYNPTLTLYFLEHYQKNEGYPAQLLDENLSMDRGKLTYIAALPHGPEILEAAIEQEPALTVETLAQRFGIEEILSAKKDEGWMLSLLYFFGILTLEGRDVWGELCLRVPNQVILRLYVQELRAALLPELDRRKDQELVRGLYRNGALGPVCQCIEDKVLPVFSNRDFRQVNESTFKTAFVLLLLNDQLYHLDTELPVGRGYADLTLIVRPDARQYRVLDLVIELKYVSLKAMGLSSADLAALSEEECTAHPAVERAFAEAKGQVQRYTADLLQRYGKVLNLRGYVVVGLGLSRLLWQEISLPTSET